MSQRYYSAPVFVWAVRQLTLTSAPRWPSFCLSFSSHTAYTTQDQCAIQFDFAYATQTQTHFISLLERVSFWRRQHTSGWCTRLAVLTVRKEKDAACIISSLNITLWKAVLSPWNRFFFYPFYEASSKKKKSLCRDIFVVTSGETSSCSGEQWLPLPVGGSLPSQRVSALLADRPRPRPRKHPIIPENHLKHTEA